MSIPPLAAAILAFTGAPGPQEVPSPAIGFRHDPSHVAIVLGELSDFERDRWEGLYEPDSAPSFSSVEGAPGALRAADLEVWERAFGAPPLGRSLTVHLSSTVSVPCAIDRVGVAALSGCMDGRVASCRVAEGELEAFRSAAASHFLVTEAPPPAPGERPAFTLDAEVTASETRTIARALQDVMPEHLARIREDSEEEYRRFDGMDWVGRFRSLDERLSRGEGALELDATRLTLAPGRGQRYFVRAQWTVEGQVAFLATAWLRLEKGVVVEEIDTTASTWLRMPEFQGSELDSEFLGRILNVVDSDGDGRPEVLLLSFGYESVWIEAFRYGEAGPEGPLASYGSGC